MKKENEGNIVTHAEESDTSTKLTREEKLISAKIGRRGFMAAGVTAAAALAALVGKEPEVVRAAPPPGAATTADTVIVLWMAGGMAQTETWDPKRYTPFAVGTPLTDVLSTFPTIDTAADNIKIAEGLENVAKVMDRATVIRSFQGADLGFILHSRHQFHWHTSYVPPQPMAVPHIGSVIAKMMGPKNPNVPSFVDIGQNMEIGAEAAALKSFHTAAFLGTEYGPFLIDDPLDAAAAVRPPSDVGSARFTSRRQLYEQLLAKQPVYQFGSDFQRESLMRSMDNANRLLTSSSAKAFDLSLEPKASYANYDTGRFGRGCLLARRLVEQGTRYVEVTTEYIPFQHWDTHQDGHARTVEMHREIDIPIMQLILDLEERGLLDRTLVVLASEFGRDAVTEGTPTKVVKDQSNTPPVMTIPNHYGMHRHFTAAGSVVMWGGGVKKGYVYGKTADERPCIATENPATCEDLIATMYHALGIQPGAFFTVEGRPIYVTTDPTNNKRGKPITDIFA